MVREKQNTFIILYFQKLAKNCQRDQYETFCFSQNYVWKVLGQTMSLIWAPCSFTRFILPQWFLKIKCVRYRKLYCLMVFFWSQSKSKKRQLVKNNAFTILLSYFNESSMNYILHTKYAFSEHLSWNYLPWKHLMEN